MAPCVYTTGAEKLSYLLIFHINQSHVNVVNLLRTTITAFCQRERKIINVAFRSSSLQCRNETKQTFPLLINITSELKYVNTVNVGNMI